MDAPTQVEGAYGRQERIAFLDALRGIAALAVAFQHRAEWVVPGYTRITDRFFRPGQFGVILFFLCSGYVIPGALKRSGSLRVFWTRRAFRLLPVYVGVLAALVLCHYMLNDYDLPAAFTRHPIQAGLADITMIAPFVQEPLVLPVAWTLGFELAFYVMLSVVDTASGGAQRAALFAIGISGLAAVSAVTGRLPVPPVALLLGAAALWSLVNSGCGIERRAAIGGGLLAALMTLTGFGRYYGDSLDLVYFAALFTGAVFADVSNGRTPLHVLLVTMIVVTASGGLVSIADGQPGTIPTILVAYGVFAAAWNTQRSYRFRLRRLGTISYPVYLLHPMVFALFLTSFLGSRMLWLELAGPLVVTLAISAVIHRLVERPAMAIGRSRTNADSETLTGASREVSEALPYPPERPQSSIELETIKGTPAPA